MTGILAGLLGGVAAHLLGGSGVGRASPGRWAVRPAAGAFLGAGLGAAVAVNLLHGTRLVLALLSLAAAGTASREVVRRRRAAEADRRADQVMTLCEGLATDLQAGQPPVAALDAAAEEWPELSPVAAAARLGADVPEALRRLAASPGAGQLRVVAAAWQVAHRSGAGLAGALGVAARTLREDRATARVVAVEMAGARATAGLLLLLPLGVLLLGSSLGGDPVGFLLDTGVGVTCLGAGLALGYLGLCWLERIAGQATGR